MIAVSDGKSLELFLEADQVSNDTLETAAKGNFLVLPHREVPRHIMGKAKDYAKLISSMVRIHAISGE